MSEEQQAQNTQTVDKFLQHSITEDDTRKVVGAILHSVLLIGELLRSGGTSSCSTSSSGAGPDQKNSFGDTQLQIDVQSDAIIRDALRATRAVYISSSEEDPEERVLSEDGTLSVSYDPLDGSSVMGSNFAVGSIFAVWRTDDRKIVGHNGHDVILSVAAVYGHRLNVFIGMNDQVYEISLYKELSHAVNCVRTLQVGLLSKKEGGEKGKLFAPANLKSSVELEAYDKAITQWYMKEKYTLRYTGAMVPDVTQLLVRGYGIFVSPVSHEAKAKLRLIYEVVPMGHLIACAGGKATDCGSQEILDIEVGHCEDRIGCCLGSVEEVERFEQFIHN